MAKRGRKTLFRDEIIRESEVMAGLGLTEAQISNVFHISHGTLIRWKKRNPEFDEALKRGAVISNNEVVKSLYKRAMGYQYDEIHYEKSKIGGLGIQLKKGEVENIKHTDTYKTKVITKLIVPDVTAQIFWLKNRLPEQWRDRQPDEVPNTHIHINYGHRAKSVISPLRQGYERETLSGKTDSTENS